MNLFRSEEHVRRWSRFDAASTERIVSASRLHAVLFARIGRYRERLAPDYLKRVTELSSGMIEALAEVSGGSAYRKPR
jgi:hypothetical protein